ncbi:MAG: Gfo/Idh/MocA family oxidoreductase [Pirellulales bacterium]|nr:Gfo/Idh/MocA family oxidoreductase [Pirellulales bacterium]
MHQLRFFLAPVVLSFLAMPLGASDGQKPIRVGIIGLDTSHAVAFTKTLNAPDNQGDLAGVRVVAAYPGGSPDNPGSWNRVSGFTKQLRKMGVEIVGSIDELLPKVDAVMLMSIDGRTHLKQARSVIAAGKPLYIDKPLAGSLADALKIFQLAEEKNVPCFSASSLRFSSGFQAARSGKSRFGKVRGCTAWSPLHLEAHHPDLFWYGIHGVETLFTIMGPGCEKVKRAAPNKVIGVWKDGRKGIFKEGTRRSQYGATVEGEKATGSAGKYEGYPPLVVAIAKFFKTGKPPVAAEETVEIYAFMEAADESRRRGGAEVTLANVLDRAKNPKSPTVPDLLTDLLPEKIQRRFADYVPLAPVALITDEHPADRKTMSSCLELISKNIPFVWQKGGRSPDAERLDARRLGLYKAVIVASDKLDLDAVQKKVLEEVRKQGRLIEWPDNAKLQQLVGKPLRIEGSNQVRATVRGIPWSASSSGIVELVKLPVNPQKSGGPPLKNITVRVRKDLFPNRAFQKAFLHVSETQPAEIPLSADGDYYSVKIAELPQWAIVELRDQ